MSLDLNVKVDATTAPYEAAIGRAQRATLQYDQSLARLQSDMAALEKSMDDDISAALDRQHQAMTKTGRAAFVFGAAVAAGLGMAVNEAVKWESAWTGVTKTVDGSVAEMEQLEGGLRQLALTLPATHEEIAAVAEAAGQLGIKRESILGFTKTMIDLSETTNLTADQAATDMARFANIMQTPQDQIDRLGAALVALGNDGASTEADILSMGMRIAGAGATIGLTEGEVMGLANALSSVGIEAEAGGSAISSVMKTIELKTTQGTQAVEGFAKVAGMSSQAFMDLWNQDSAAGLNAFITGLGKVESQGGNTVATLQELGFTQIRQSDSLLRLANAGDLLTESLELGNRAWDENSALLAEAEKRYQTTEARVQVARNQLRDAAIDVGAVLLPALATLADVVADLGAAWGDIPGPVKVAGVALGVLAAAVGLFGGAALMAVPKIAAFKTAVAGLEAGALKTAGTRLMGLGSFIAGPWGLAIGAGITVLGLFAAKHGEAAREVEALKATLDEQTGAITENSREWAIKRLIDDGVLQNAKELGLDLQLVTDAALGNADAAAELALQLDGLRVAAAASGDQEAVRGLNAIGGAVDDTAGIVRKGQTEWQLYNEASAGAAAGADNAAGAQKGVTAAWQEGSGAATELSEDIKTLQDLFDELTGGFLNQREAGRQVRDSMREIRAAIADYKKEHGGLAGAFKANTKSGDEFAGMLDGLAKDYQNQIDVTAEVTASEEKTQAAYDRSRAKLIDVAQQLGMTKKEAELYADQALSTPDIIKTYFDAQTGPAEQAIDNLRRQMYNLDGTVSEVYIRTIRQNVVEDKLGAPKANGGIVQAYAAGGFTFGGQYVERVPQLRQGGGAIMWNEPETGWEAYVSGKPGMEARNREVWLEAGRRLGTVGSEAYANVGGRSFAHSGSAGGTRVVERVVEVRGRLDTPWGPAQIESIVDDRVAAHDSYPTGQRNHG